MTNTTEQVIEFIKLYLSSPKVQMTLKDSSIQSIAEDAAGNVDKAKATIDSLVFTRNLGQ